MPPVAGMTITAVDMAKWMHFHLNKWELNGVRLLSNDTYALMRTRAYDPLLSVMDSPLEISAKQGLLIVGDFKAPYTRIKEDLWENRLGNRLAFLRDDDGKIMRLITPADAADMDPITSTTNPMVLVMCLIATIVFSVTSWFGLWRRYGHDVQQNSAGRWMSGLALFAIVPLLVLAVVGSNAPQPNDIRFAQAFCD